MNLRNIKDYIHRLKIGFGKAKHMSLIGNMNFLEVLIIIMSISFPIFLIKFNIYIYLTFISIYISVCLSCKDKDKLVPKKKGLSHRAMLLGANTIQIFGAIFFIMSSRDNMFNIMQLIFIVLITLSILIYLGIALGFIFYLLNYLFYAFLKSVFPEELHGNNRTNFVSLKDLSKHMTLESQIIYLLITLIHIILYFCFVLYILIYLMTIDNRINGEIYPDKLVKWVTKNEIISFGNTIGLISVILTITSITAPNQIKLFKKAKNEFENFGNFNHLKPKFKFSKRFNKS